MNRSIERMSRAIAENLDGNVNSIWLYGSVVLDDFCLGWSDIDFLALADRPITEEQANRLLMLRQRLCAKDPKNPYYRSFEGIIAEKNALLSDGYGRIVYWGTSGQRITDRYRLDPFSRYELSTCGRSVYGSADRSIFAAPDSEELRIAVRRHYESIRSCAVQTDDRLYSCGWLLDIARCIYTLRYHTVISKTAAGEWALGQHLFSDEEPLLKTLEIRRNPLVYRDREEIKRWLSGLGPTVQTYADVLEREWNGSRV